MASFHEPPEHEAPAIPAHPAAAVYAVWDEIAARKHAVALVAIVFTALWWNRRLIWTALRNACARSPASAAPPPELVARLEQERMQAVQRMAEAVKRSQERELAARAATAAESELQAREHVGAVDGRLVGSGAAVRPTPERALAAAAAHVEHERAHAAAGVSDEQLAALRRMCAFQRLPSRLHKPDSEMAAVASVALTEDAAMPTAGAVDEDSGVYVITIRASDWRGEHAVRGVFVASDTLRTLGDFVTAHVPGGMAGRALVTMFPFPSRALVLSWRDYDLRGATTEADFAARVAAAAAAGATADADASASSVSGVSAAVGTVADGDSVPDAAANGGDVAATAANTGSGGGGGGNSGVSDSLSLRCFALPSRCTLALQALYAGEPTERLRRVHSA